MTSGPPDSRDPRCHSGHVRTHHLTTLRHTDGQKSLPASPYPTRCQHDHARADRAGSGLGITLSEHLPSSVRCEGGYRALRRDLQKNQERRRSWQLGAQAARPGYTATRRPRARLKEWRRGTTAALAPDCNGPAPGTTPGASRRLAAGYSPGAPTHSAPPAPTDTAVPRPVTGLSGASRPPRP